MQFRALMTVAWAFALSLTFLSGHYAFAAPDLILYNNFASETQAVSRGLFTLTPNSAWTLSNAYQVTVPFTGRDECHSLLRRSQEISAFAYAKKWGLNEAEAGEIIALADKVRPDSVRMIRSIKFVDASQFPAPPNDAELDFLRFPGSKKVPIVTSNLWSAGGWVIRPFERFIQESPFEYTSMPWEMDPQYSEFSKEHSREIQGSFGREYGRLVDLTREMSATDYALIAMGDYQRAELLYQDPKRACVFFHTIRRANTKLFLDLIGDSPVELFAQPSMITKPTLPRSEFKFVKNGVFKLPLLEFLKRLPPSKYSEMVRDLKRVSGERLSDLDALDLIRMRGEMNYLELDYRPSGVTGPLFPEPIILNDHSSLLYHRVKAQLVGRLKFSNADSNLIIAELARRPVPIGGRNGSTRKNLVDTSSNQDWMHAQRAVEISNLSDDEARRNPGYVAEVLAGVYFAYSMLLQSAYLEPINVYESEQRPTFVLTTDSSEVMRQAEALSPQTQFSIIEKTEGDGIVWRVGADGSLEAKVGPAPRAFAFTPRQLDSLLTRPMNSVVGQGHFHLMHMLSRVDLF